MSRPTPARAVERFVRVDLVGAVVGVAFVVVANAAFIRETEVWLVLPPLAVLVACLVVAQRSLPDHVTTALSLVAAGNWIVALCVSGLFPFLWPAMVPTVLLPLVLATPLLDSRSVRPAIAAATLMTGLVGAIGLLNDDGGVLADIDDTFEFIVVIGALGALTVPIALVIRQNNTLQRDALEQLAASRRRVVEAADVERSRIERDLHDGAQQRLIAMRMRLQLAANTADGPGQTVLAELTRDVDDAIAELRELAHGIYPPELAANGLADALMSAVRRAPDRFRPEISAVGRLAAPIERALYFTALEAMSNAAKHTHGNVSVRLERTGTLLRLEVSDEGPGFENGVTTSSIGLTSMTDRLDAVGGELTIRSCAAGTTVAAHVPAPDR